MGTKRSREGQPLVADAQPPIPSASVAMDVANAPPGSVLAIFETFRDELDEHHDRRERIIKTSRDITALSKKIIFALQRIRSLNQPLPSKIAQENQTRLDRICTLFTTLVPDLTGINAWRYQRQISSGIQEYIEALGFDHYLRTQTLITHAEVAARLPAAILVSEEDYLMGLFDLTGEMMRFAVMALSSGNAAASHAPPVQSTEHTEPTESAEQHRQHPSSPTGRPGLAPSHAGIVTDLRAMRARFEALSVPRRHSMIRDLVKKMEVMQTSVEKVERAAYGILVRGSERPSGWTPDLSGRVEVESH